MGTGAFLAVKATLKFETVSDAAAIRVAQVKELAGVEHYDTENEYQRALAKAYMHNALEFTKLYGPAISLFLTGAGAVLAAHGIMRQRNAAIVAAYNAIEKSFSAYRKRVIEDLGEEKDRDYRFGITETSEIDENGKKHAAVVIDPTKASRYARVFDETNEQWQDEPGFNQFFLTQTQAHMNDRLSHFGHVFLNEVYDALGFERTQEGSVVGWILSEEGDNYIDFNMYDLSNQAKRNFINGYENSIWLDFNVDGIIFDKIETRKQKMLKLRSGNGVTW
jgi:hypothetical protein